ncbi:MAG: CBS domain-containing protein [Candidatus Omnitrophica bacterium]|nr:CBS domain-containing protein [Candidatus Omnitrophota bacterium]
MDNNELNEINKHALEQTSTESLKQVKAKDIMSKFAVTVEETASLTEAANLLMRFKISGLPVVDISGNLVGIITSTDLFNIMGETVDNLSLPKNYANVKQVMKKDVITIEEETTLIEIIQIMFQKNIHTLPVVSKGEIKGVLGRRDVFNKYYKLLKVRNDQ